MRKSTSLNPEDGVEEGKGNYVGFGSIDVVHVGFRSRHCCRAPEVLRGDGALASSGQMVFSLETHWMARFSLKLGLKFGPLNGLKVLIFRFYLFIYFFFLNTEMCNSLL